ncbi:hypothetical protein OZX72_09385 [Bifidobacterium sp. ESL0769]|uniref:hypothetical protein n=1 Tax=Bifidobacterium sp. ESL0769 TaxID=2983229 RepID=UPI0023F6DE34|nr:hypothetical protein [Bifidobacterium sp. ESL0769]WEV67423.1 hypothetical protein OZX72_09385 [Bifidobacterium sp. ESL0769]
MANQTPQKCTPHTGQDAGLAPRTPCQIESLGIETMFEQIKKYKKDREWHWDDSKAVMYTGEEAQRQANADLLRFTGATSMEAAMRTLSNPAHRNQSRISQRDR